MAVARKKLSRSGWILLFAVFVGIIAIVVLAIVGILDFSWLVGENGILISLALWASGSPVNIVMLLVAPFAGGMIVFYFLKSYIIGEKQVMVYNTGVQQTGGYNPQPTTPSQPQQQQETEVSV